MSPRRVAAALALCGLAALFAGCSKKSNPASVVAPTPPPPAAPVADTPEHAVQRLQWAYRNRSADVYRTLFTSDYVFAFATLDPAGDPYRGGLWGRDNELACAQHLFVGGSATEEAAASISLTFDATLIALNDPRQGVNTNRWHKLVRTGVVLDIQRPSSSLQVKGQIYLYCVRGDSARVPAGLGLPADSTRWYIDAWSDDTSQPGTPNRAARARPAAAQPAKSTSWGLIKTLYLP